MGFSGYKTVKIPAVKAAQKKAVAAAKRAASAAKGAENASKAIREVCERAVSKRTGKIYGPHDKAVGICMRSAIVPITAEAADTRPTVTKRRAKRIYARRSLRKAKRAVRRGWRW